MYMKIMKSYTISVENTERLKNVSNASELIDDLLTKFFMGEESEESLRAKFHEADRLRNLAEEKLQNKMNERIKLERLNKERKELTEEQLKRKAEVDEIKRKFANKEITEVEYWDFFDQKP